MLSTHLIQILFLPVFFSFISVAFASNSCPKEMLKIRLENTDLPSLLSGVNINDSIPYTLTYHCRAHSFTEPTWVTNVIVALSFGSVNVTYITLMQYECNSNRSFDSPKYLIPVAVSTPMTRMIYLKNNSKADSCYSCVNDSIIGYCESCHPSCNSSDIIYNLGFCYGSAQDQCCNYIQDDNCTSGCDDAYYPDTNSVCTFCELECGNMTLNETECGCVCRPGYSGDQCENYICDPNPCNEGNCSVIGNQTIANTSCTCPAGYSGAYCDTVIDPCLFDPCNNGTCNMINTTSYSCTCNPGYVGSDCSSTEPCLENNICSSNGVCNTTENMPYFLCNCTEGFTGVNCQYNQLCNNNTEPCKNNGQCSTDGTDGYICSCTAGYTGDDCETSAVSGSSAATIAVVLIIIIIIIVILVIVLVILLVYFFYIRPKKGRVEISKKTSRVHPTNGDSGTADEKAPILEKHKH